MRDFLAGTLGPELSRSGWGTDKLNVMIHDHNLDDIQTRVPIIFANSTARNYATGIAIHWYSHSPQSLLDPVHNQYPEKFILATEACEGPGVRIGAWSMAQRYAYDIIQVNLFEFKYST